ncbi:hypothetical protein BSKO_08417 [Bryopsis sp. KO-2023]|nr:hypothetical protein BSKO_08417 [Bryopsis sp. KO-2023]
MRVISLVCLASIFALSYGQSTDVYEGLILKVEQDSLQETQGILPTPEAPTPAQASSGSRQSNHTHRMIQGASLVLLGTILSSILLIVWYYGPSPKAVAAAGDPDFPPLREIQVHANRIDGVKVEDLAAGIFLDGTASDAAKEEHYEEKVHTGVALKSISEPLRITRPISEIIVVRRSTGDVVGLQSSEHRRKTRRKCFTCY